MPSPAVVTAVTLVVPPSREAEVAPAYRDLVAGGPRVAGLLRSELLRATDGRWLVRTLWRDRDAVLAARAAGVPPAALLMAERLGADHSHDVLTVVETL